MWALTLLLRWLRILFLPKEVFMADIYQGPVLTKDQKEKALQHLKIKWGDGYKCECCGKDHFMLQDHIVAPPLFSGGLIVGGVAYPQAMIVCANCGNTKYVNAIMAGIVTPNKGELDG